MQVPVAQTKFTSKISNAAKDNMHLYRIMMFSI